MAKFRVELEFDFDDEIRMTADRVGYCLWRNDSLICNALFENERLEDSIRGKHPSGDEIACYEVTKIEKL